VEVTVDWNDARAAVAALCDPATGPDDLVAIVRRQPQLRQAATEHPAAWPGLFDQVPLFAVVGTPPVRPDGADAARVNGSAVGPLDGPKVGSLDGAIVGSLNRATVRLPIWQRRITHIILGLAIVLALGAYAAALFWQEANKPLSVDQFALLLHEILPPTISGRIEGQDMDPSVKPGEGLQAWGYLSRTVNRGEPGFPDDLAPADIESATLGLLDLALFDDNNSANTWWQKIESGGDNAWAESTGPVRLFCRGDVADPRGESECAVIYRNVVAQAGRWADYQVAADLLGEWKSWAVGPFKDAVNEALER
jgi:hypothetical protein